jgi:Na+/proline symporter
MMQELTPGIILTVIIGYFLLLIGVSWFTGRKSDNETFFLAGRNSPWLLVAIGMVGATLSGVTFISIPGVVGSGGANQAYSYMQMALGYLVGYLFIGRVLLPLYYRMNLTSIYAYLGDRFGPNSYKVGSAFFMLSRTVGASFRLYLIAIVLQQFVLGPFGIPFWATVLTTIVLIWIYTFRGGINTIVWTDTLQTTFMILAVVLTTISISNALELDLAGLTSAISSSDYNQVFFFEGGWSDPNNFFKQFISGALITIVMTGLDQDMIQKNLTCRNIGEAQKNMATFSIALFFVIFLFLTLGALLYIYASQVGIPVPEQTDKLFPTIALQHLPPFVGIIFILGLIAAAYSSADSALTALTTAFCIDFLGFESTSRSDKDQRNLRFRVHIMFSGILFLAIIGFNQINDDAVISKLFEWAGYTYGPILGLFSFALFTRLKIRDRLVVPVCILAPIISYLLNRYSSELLYGFEFGFLIIALNGLLTFIGLLAISYKEYEVVEEDTNY